jgi:hypothetical protein
MSRTVSCVALFATVSISLSLFAPAVHAQTAKPQAACELVSVAELRTLSGRNDLSTRPERSDTQGALSICERSGTFDVTIMTSPSNPARFTQMRETFAKAPPSAGFKVERVPGVGDDAYFAIRGERVQIFTLAGGKQVTIELKKSYMEGSAMPPEPQAKAIALKLAKAAAAKLR